MVAAADCAAAGAVSERDTSWSLERASVSASTAPLAASTAPLAASFARATAGSRIRSPDATAAVSSAPAAVSSASRCRRRCFEALHHVIGGDVLGEQAEIARAKSHSGEQVVTIGSRCNIAALPRERQRKSWRPLSFLKQS